MLRLWRLQLRLRKLLLVLFGGHQHLLCRMEIELRIVEVEIGHDNPDQSFGLV